MSVSFLSQHHTSMSASPSMSVSPIFPARSRWLIFGLSTICMFIIAGLCTGIATIAIPDKRFCLLVSSILQGLLLFITPTMLTWYLTSTDPWRKSGISTALPIGALGLSLLLYMVAYPLMSQCIFWNQNMHLPESMSALEAVLKEMEDAAQLTTQQILGPTSVGSLIVNILIVGIFTGFAEEMFFRGGLQKLMIGSGLKPAAAILIAAFVFSAVHMQFYGFLPRFLLGAVFGYVYWKTGSIWTAAVLHALNNSLVIIFSWLSASGIMTFDPDTFLVTEAGFPWPATLSLLVTIALITLWRKHIPVNSNKI